MILHIGHLFVFLILVQSGWKVSTIVTMTPFSIRPPIQDLLSKVKIRHIFLIRRSASGSMWKSSHPPSRNQIAQYASPECCHSICPGEKIVYVYQVSSNISIGALASSGFGIWNAVSEQFQVFCSRKNAGESIFLQIIRSGEPNSAPECRCASLYSIEVIKISRLTMDRCLILWLCRCCETDRETDCKTPPSLEMQDVQRGQLWCAQNSHRNHHVFNWAYPFAWSHLKCFCLHPTENTRVDLISIGTYLLQRTDSL